MKIFVYGLFDPREPDIIRYVGQTANFQNRFRQHMSGKDRCTKEWASRLRSQGVLPSIKILEETDDLNAGIVERKWIYHFKETVSECNQKIEEPKEFEFRVSPIVTLRDMEQRYIAWAINRCDGNKLKAAQMLGIGRQTLYNKLNEMFET